MRDEERCWTGGIQDRGDAGMKGCRKRGKKERRDAEKERCWTGGIQERWKWNA